MIQTYITTKKRMTQAWRQDGKRIAVSILEAKPVKVIKVKTIETDGYDALVVGLGSQKESRLKKPQVAAYKKAGLKEFPQNTREIRLSEPSEAKVGDMITIDQVLEVGDIINAQGTTKGRGFAGVMKRWGFSGGPRTHGQSDRERAPGSIGQGTDPGRVHKGKKMPGHYGNVTKTIKNLVVVNIDVDNHHIWVSGPVPGSINSMVTVTKTGQKKNFIKLNLPESEAKEDVKTEETKKDSEPIVESKVKSKPEAKEEVKPETKEPAPEKEAPKKEAK